MYETNLKEGLPKVPARLIQDKEVQPVNVRATAVAVLAKVGGKEVAAELEKLWEDETNLIKAVSIEGKQIWLWSVACRIDSFGRKGPQRLRFRHNGSAADGAWSDNLVHASALVPIK